MAELALHLFGSPRVLGEGRPLRFDTRKALALLAYLAVTGTPQPRDVLAALLWPEADQARARATLRRTLSAAAVVGPALQTDGGDVHLDSTVSWCDVSAFVTASGSEQAADWRRADELVVGPFMAGFGLRDSPLFDDWLESTADSLRTAHSAILARLVDVERTEGSVDAALGYARRRVTLDPLSEPAHAGLIEVTAASGDRPGALQRYRELVHILDRELGVPPLPETTALHDAIRADRVERSNRPEPPGEPPTASPPVADSARLVLVGREVERVALRTAWADSEYHARVIGVTGPAGSGRTALLDELAEWVEASGGRVVRLSAHASEQQLALAVGMDLIRELLSDSSRPRSVVDGLDTAAGQHGGIPSVESSGAQRELFETVLAALVDLSSPKTPVLLAVDDAHWLDPASAELLAFVIRRRPVGLLTVVSWTTGHAGAPLPAAVRDLMAELLTLAPFTAPDIELLLEGTAMGSELTASEVLQRTGGLPLLVSEYLAASPTARNAADEVLDVVAARLETAPPTTQQVVGAAVVLGTVSDPELLRHTCGRTEEETVDALEDAVARGLLVEQRDRAGYDVPHDLVRDVVTTRTSLARTRLLHGRAADELARRHASSAVRAPAGAVARHLTAAGRDAEAAEWHWRAADESLRLYAHTETLEHTRAALGLGFYPASGHLRAGDTLTLMGRYPAALLEYEQAAASTTDPSALAEAEHRIAHVNDRLGDWAAAETHLESARLLLTADADPARSARVTADLALVRHRLGHSDHAAELAEASLASAVAAGDQRGKAQAENVLGMVWLAQGDLTGAIDQLQAAVATAEQLDDPGLLVAALNNVSRAQLSAGDVDAARTSAARALDLAERQGDLHRAAALHSQLADVLHAAGEEEAALHHLKASAAGFTDVQGAEIRAEIWTLSEW